MTQLLMNRDLLAPAGCRPAARQCKAPALVRAASRRPAAARAVVVATTGFSGKDRMVLESQIMALDGTMMTELSDDVTHLVVNLNGEGQCPRTYKYLQSLLRGRWIVTRDWITKSAKQGKWLEEAAFEVQADSHGIAGVAARARVNRESQLPQLFDGCQFYLHGDFENPSRQELITLIEMAGGKVLLLLLFFF